METFFRNFTCTILSIEALAIYSRCPSAFRAVRDLKILQLPCEKVLKAHIKSSSEKPGIDEKYLEGQKEKFDMFAQDQASQGRPIPLQLGALIFDEVKVRYALCPLLFRYALCTLLT